VVNAWRPTPFVSKAEVRQWPLVGWLAQQLDTIFLQREKRSDAKRIMHELSERLVRGELMCVFPEGTTSLGHDLLPFHSNLFQAAVSASRPVQPICLMYEDANGRQAEAPAYIDDLTLAFTLNAMLRDTPLTAHLCVCDAIEPGADRRVLAKQAQAAVEAALRQMQQGLGAPVAVVSNEAGAVTEFEAVTPRH
jgi:1-acyl-sn-glycerol-3-phosphate acyltransferase